MAELMLFVAPFMHTNARGLRAFVRTSLAAIPFAVAQHSLARLHHAVTTRAGAFDRRS